MSPRLLTTASIALALLLAAPDIAVAQANVPGGKIIALLVFDTRSNLGDHMNKDETNIKKVIESGIHPDLRDRLRQFEVFKDADANKKRITDWLRTVPVGADDTLLFYFTGHGGTTPIDKRHVMLLSGTGRQEFLPRDEVRDLMRARNPRLAVLLTDSCSDFVPNMPVKPRGEGDIAFRAPMQVGVSAGIGRLFFQERGLVDINAAYEGTYAWTDDNGGLFTRYLVHSMAVGSADPTITWVRMAGAIRSTNERLYSTWRDATISGLQADGKWAPAAIKEHEAIEVQKTQAPQVYFVPGIKLGIGTRDAGEGRGVRIDAFVVGSAVERAGVKRDEAIVEVDGQTIRSEADMIALVDPKLAANQREFRLQVRGTDGQVREVKVSLDR